MTRIVVAAFAALIESAQINEAHARFVNRFMFNPPQDQIIVSGNDASMTCYFQRSF